MTKVIKYRNGWKINKLFYHGFQYKMMRSNSDHILLDNTRIVHRFSNLKYDVIDETYVASKDPDNFMDKETYELFYGVNYGKIKPTTKV